MPRKVLDIVPIITARFIGAGTVTTEEGARAQVEDAIAALGKDFECTVAFDVDDRCSFCNSPWTEAGSDHNASCCPQDDANNPERLKTIAELAEAVGNDTFYRYDEGQRGRVVVNWPDQLGMAVSSWLESGRPAEDAKRLLSLAGHVRSSGWCTVWSDPGPSGCSLARLPDQVTVDGRPEDLAHEIASLIDDMALTPAKAAA